MKPDSAQHGCGAGGRCSPADDSPSWDRRKFLKLVGLGTGAVAFRPWPAMAGPFTRADFESLVPADKKLRPDWVKSLTERGERTVYRGQELNHIGMPIGGLCAGQVYLGGDGKLWHWDIFNRHIGTGAEHYAKPMQPDLPVEQGFAVRITSEGKTQEREFGRAYWKDVSFIGEYPIGYVDYRDPESPVAVRLEAFSPFIPLNTDDSSLPATLMEFTIANQASVAVDVEMVGWLENAVCLHSAKSRDGLRRNRVMRTEGLLLLQCSAEEKERGASNARPEIVFEDFESDSYAKWEVTGTAFGSGPIELANVPAYQGELGGKGKRAVNSHASAPGNTVAQKDSAMGTLTSRPFTLERDYISFLIGGGAHASKTCMNLRIDDRVVLSATGSNDNRMHPVTWDVRRWAGKTGRLEIIDQESGPWGNVGVDDIRFSDTPGEAVGPLAAEADFGTLGLGLLAAQAGDVGHARKHAEGTLGREAEADVRSPFDQQLIGALSRKVRLEPGASEKVTFVVTWHMPNLRMKRLPSGRHYATRFDSALGVAEYVQRNFARLSSQTRLWHDTWYDSTLPYWFLDRTFLNTSILATSTCYRFGNGRFYGWEGVGCCEGTCGHVWHYAQAAARLFPELERSTREAVDFGLALQADGAIHFRGEFNNFPAIDGQAGAILRGLREHQASPDDSFLKRNWPRIRRATEWLIRKDGDGDGLIEGNQHNTLDTDWFGPVAWLSGLYLAALHAAQAMAQEIGDQEFALKCRSIGEAGQKNLVARLFDGEYFTNRPDPKHLEAINSGSGCEIDQVMGQSWAFQVGLPRVLPEKETRAALKSLWRYNFTPDVGPYRAAYKPGRWYAMPGEAGLLMCTFPRSDWDYAQAKGKGADWAAGYFNECMNGFEYQAAGHMIWEGLVTEGLAITRAVHDRYHASRRNPWNEVECGDHYARSMASYGVFLAACGFEYHGPKEHLGFVPRVMAGEPTPVVIGAASRTPRTFQCAFTAAEGWGTYSQTAESGNQSAEVVVKWGKLRVRTLALGCPPDIAISSVRVAQDGRALKNAYRRDGGRVVITLATETEIGVGGKIEVAVA
jgi:non-lysosomal glucosylceramidase